MAFKKKAIYEYRTNEVETVKEFLARFKRDVSYYAILDGEVVKAGVDITGCRLKHFIRIGHRFFVFVVSGV